MATELSDPRPGPGRTLVLERDHHARLHLEWTPGLVIEPADWHFLDNEERERMARLLQSADPPIPISQCVKIECTLDGEGVNATVFNLGHDGQPYLIDDNGPVKGRHHQEMIDDPANPGAFIPKYGEPRLATRVVTLTRSQLMEVL